MHEVLVNHLGGLILPRKSVVRLTDRPDMTLDVYRRGKTTMQQQQKSRHRMDGWKTCSFASFLNSISVISGEKAVLNGTQFKV